MELLARIRMAIQGTDMNMDQDHGLCTTTMEEHSSMLDHYDSIQDIRDIRADNHQAKDRDIVQDRTKVDIHRDRHILIAFNQYLTLILIQITI